MMQRLDKCINLFHSFLTQSNNRYTTKKYTKE